MTQHMEKITCTEPLNLMITGEKNESLDRKHYSKTIIKQF